MLRRPGQIERDSSLGSETFLQYADATAKERNINEINWGHSTVTELPSVGHASREKQQICDFCISFDKLATGPRGPFSRVCVSGDTVNVGKLFADLWPLGPPNRGTLRYCVEGETREDYI